MPLVDFKAKARIEEALYLVKFLGVELFPKTQEDCAKMNFKEQQYSWAFKIIQQGKYFGELCSGLTPLTWTPRNKLGKWIALLGMDAQLGGSEDPNKYAGKEFMAHVVNYESKRSGLIFYQVKDLFPAAGVSGGLVAQSTLGQNQQAPVQDAIKEVAKAESSVTPSMQSGAVDSTEQPQQSAVEQKKEVKATEAPVKKKFNW